MKLAGLWLVALAACTNPVGGDDYTVLGGGSVGTGGHGSGGGGGGSGSGDPGTITSRVCVVTDPLNLRGDIGAHCATNVSGISVLADDGVTQAQATTDKDGFFTLVKPTGSVWWTVAGAGIVTSLQPDGYAGWPLMAVTQPQYDKMRADNGVTTDDTTGAIMARLERESDLSGAQGYTATVMPATTGYPTFYDDPSTASKWGTTMTGLNATVWVANLTPQDAPYTFTVDLNNGNFISTNMLRVEANTITFIKPPLGL